MKFPLFILLLLLVFASCKKDGDDNNDLLSNCRLTKIQDIYGGSSGSDEMIISYTGDGKINTIVESYHLTKFVYGANGQLDTIKEYSDGDLVEDYILEYNGAGEVSVVHQYEYYSTPAEYSYSHLTYTNGRLTGMNTTDPHGDRNLTFTYDGKGNLIAYTESIDSVPNVVSGYYGLSSSHTYGSDPNPFQNVYPSFYCPLCISKNMVISSTEIYDLGSASDTNYYTYANSVNLDGLVTQSIETRNDGSTSTTLFTYDCED